jgi:hypothetical protein
MLENPKIVHLFFSLRISMISFIFEILCLFEFMSRIKLGWKLIKFDIKMRLKIKLSFNMIFSLMGRLHNFWITYSMKKKKNFPWFFCTIQIAAQCDLLIAILKLQKFAFHNQEMLPNKNICTLSHRWFSNEI